MSTKSTVYDDGYIDFYEETLEPQYTFGKFRGWNLHLIVVQDIIKTIKFSDDYMTIEIDKNTIIQSAYKSFPEIKLWLHSVLSIEIDKEYAWVVLKGGEYWVNELIERLRIKEKDLN